ncbi:ATP synthase F1 subunit epsilon [Mycoplasmopsis gallopavonis]|uniref:ATP synthase epsilon chain n=1 Tax=Mycoplasmopsis gallopavonis TaxID=76629 RepID=A0A449AZA2_9BACT|nr:ATP synthase F1 subunit epsilon [Mycoplasmopsis gallopavonis]RIV16648.1 ATP synthase F1 subunit epsilon [Mycoplasmopsis gallopavonis]VEU72853.1 ATP synthase epsilon subunit [Mycoplasmopsis gallopavonis]
MAKEIKLTITTPNGIFYEGTTEIVSLRTASGYIGLQSGRTPLFSSVETGSLIIGWENNPSSIKCFIGGGLVYADSNKINIITDDITDVRQIDLAQAERERDKIKQQLSSKKDNIDISKLEIKLKKTLSRIETYNQFNK